MRRWQKFALNGTLGFQGAVLDYDPVENQTADIWVAMPFKQTTLTILNQLHGALGPHHVHFSAGAPGYVAPLDVTDPFSGIHYVCTAVHPAKTLVENWTPVAGWGGAVAPQFVAAELMTGFLLTDGSRTDRLLDAQSFFEPGDPGYNG